MSRFLRIVTANIKAYPAMPQRHVRADLVAIADQLRPDVLGTQEMWFPRYRQALRRVLPLPRYGHHAPSGIAGTCVSWAVGPFRHLQSGSRILHHAIPGVCGRRRIRWVGLEHEGHRIAVASVHPTPSAFSQRYRPARRARIRRRWERGMANLRVWALDMRKAGYTHLAIVGDFNARRPRVEESLLRLGVPFGGFHVRSHDIDHVVLVGRWDVLTHGVRQAPFSDHDPLFVDARPV